MPIYKKSGIKGSRNYKPLDNNVDYGTRQIDQMPIACCDPRSPYGGQFGERTLRACERVTSLCLSACKAIFVGDVSAGKSSLVNRFCHDVFDRNYNRTIGVDFEVEKFLVLAHAFNLQICDTAGYERFRCTSESYYRNANAVVVVFDLTNAESLRNAERWLDEALQLNRPEILRFLVGTKRDLLVSTPHNQIENEAKQMAREMKAEFWSVSAESGENVTKFFRRLTALSFDTTVQRLLGSNNPISHPSGNSLLNLYYLKEDRKIKKSKKCSFCRIN
ncbi:ras-related protein Rab-34 [Wyeomyia smithii]|uniref:ras-related protein Rab-34 n=1 Tax=Wyeomyia smithii TaxID=174621 RepID=UPI002467D47F|nr:ras-related protein Rab-34 [Wyeomyia smithii]